MKTLVSARNARQKGASLNIIDHSTLSQAEDIDASLLKAMPLARHLKQRILSERKLTATIGIASNKLLAKIASGHKNSRRSHGHFRT